MNNYRLTIQYDGGRYKGWQRLGNEENTIQGKIEQVFSEMAGGKVEITGSGRTDAGVHALAQIANVKLAKNWSEQEIMTYVNRYLPHDISITEVKNVHDRFHARYNAEEKIYLYKIWNRVYTHPFMRKYSMHVEQPLHLGAMQEAATHFLGEHDFTTFTNAKSKKKTMVRTIYTLHIEEQDGMISIRVSGDGFLYNMVRKMVGTLIQVGLGKVDPKSIPDILAAKQRDQAPFMAEANGLYLEKVVFNEDVGKA